MPRTKPPLAPIDPTETLLSLDVSSSAVGWALLNRKEGCLDFGLIKAPSSWDSVKRMRFHAKKVGDEVMHRADHAVLEWQSHKSAAGPRVQGLAVLGQAQGVMYARLCGTRWTDDGIDLVSEREWTKSVPKQKRAFSVRLLCPAYAKRVANGELKDDGLDVADSIGLGLWRLSIN